MIRLSSSNRSVNKKLSPGQKLFDWQLAAIQPGSKFFGIGMMRGSSFGSIAQRALRARALLLRVGLTMSLSADLVAIPAQAAPLPDPVRDGISQSLTDSATCWSRNDLDGFMRSYEDSPETTYVTGHKLVRGFQAIRAMYASRFDGRTSLGRLSFSLEEVRLLGTGFALAIGRYELIRAGLAAPASGIFTLVFHRAQARWTIVSDHTSS